MKRWQMDGIGRDHLSLTDVPIPTPKPGEVLVKVGAVALNHRDKMVIETGRGLPLAFPFTPCSDLAGSVVALGEGTTRFVKGDAVISVFTPEWRDGLRPGDARTPAYRTLGGYYPGVLAEYVALPEGWLVAAPRTWSAMEASTLPCAGLTAWFALVERGRVRAGETVLVEGTGGVALFGVQIAKRHGARVLVSAGVEEHARAQAVGADLVVDRRAEDWVECVYRVTGDRGADQILELVGGAHLGKAVAVAAIGGRIHQIGALGGFEIASPLMPLLMKDVTIHGIGTGHRRALEDLVRAVDVGGWSPVIDTVYSLPDFPAALEHLTRGAFGKIVMSLAS